MPRIDVPAVQRCEDRAQIVVAKEADQFTHDPQTETPVQVNLVGVDAVGCLSGVRHRPCDEDIAQRALFNPR
jgi:hypothetical protein